MNDVTPSSGNPVVAVHPYHRGCSDCGLFQRIPDGEFGQTVRCTRCNSWLRQRRRDPVQAAFACTVTCVILYVVALSTSLLTLDLYGRTHTVDLLTGPVALWHDSPGLAAVGALVMFATVLMPGVVIALNFALLQGSSRPVPPGWLPRLMRFRSHLRPWSMIEVYMLGVFVAYTKLVDLARVEVQPAIYALAAIMVLMIASDGAFDEHAVWERIGLRSQPERDPAAPERPRPRGMAAIAARLRACDECGLVHETRAPLADDRPLRCLRCDAAMHHRKPNSFPRTIAFLASATVLYVPANILPVLTLTKLGRGEPSTILAGVEELYSSGMLPLALLVFFASITVPCLKVLGLALMLAMTRFAPDLGLVDRTRLFRLIDFIGRWSMIDVFMISILVAIVHFGFIANVSANPGVIAFAAVVVLTIFAADSFDPRLMWDAGERRAAERAGGRPRGAAASNPDRGSVTA